MTRPQGSATDKLDDADYPPCTIGTAANLLGVQPAFLRSLDAAGLLTAGCSAGGQRRYSRAELALATRVRELLDQNMPLTAATGIVTRTPASNCLPAHHQPRTDHCPARHGTHAGVRKRASKPRGNDPEQYRQAETTGTGSGVGWDRSADQQDLGAGGGWWSGLRLDSSGR